MSMDRLKGMLRRVLRHGNKASTPSQQAQVESLADELHGDVEVLETYGFSAVPPESVAEGLAAFLGGESDHGVVLGWFDKTHRPTDLQPGEVCVYDLNNSRITLNKDGEIIAKSQSGSTVTLLKNGDVVIKPASNQTIIDSNLRVNGNLLVNGSIASVASAGGSGASIAGDVRATGDVVAANISLQGHVHGGVQPGGATTQGPQ